MELRILALDIGFAVFFLTLHLPLSTAVTSVAGSSQLPPRRAGGRASRKERRKKKQENTGFHFSGMW
jgi:hypothetical protein